MNTNRYISIDRLNLVRRSKRQHKKGRKQKAHPKKDKPPSRTPNRIAKFTRRFSRGKFGFFHSAPVIRNCAIGRGGTGCRSPPPVNRFEKFKFD